MAIITIAGITVPVARGGFVKRAPERIGTASRAYAGNLRSTYRSEKANYQITSTPLAEATCVSVEAAVTLGAQVTVGGTVLGSSITAVVEVQDNAYVPTHGGAWLRVLTLLIRQV